MLYNFIDSEFEYHIYIIVQVNVILEWTIKKIRIYLFWKIHL